VEKLAEPVPSLYRFPERPSAQRFACAHKTHPSADSGSLPLGYRPGPRWLPSNSSVDRRRSAETALLREKPGRDLGPPLESPGLTPDVQECSVPIERVFRILAAENATMRALWTAEIVGAGTKAVLKFDEKWREPAVAAGPLPALFLRESATALQKTRVPLGLFLGSDT